jgi:energy-coupling factor transporter transmembrane protein EcfT
MITIVLIIAVFLLLSWFIYLIMLEPFSGYKSDLSEKILCGFLILIFSGFVSLLAGLALSMGFTKVFPSYKYSTYTRLYSFVNGHSIDGNFALGCGTIKDKDYYFILTLDSEDVLHYDKMDTNETSVKTWDRNYAVLKKSYRICKYKILDISGFKSETDTIIIPKNCVIKRVNYDISDFSR